MARRNGVTLIVTLLHCPAMTEIDSAKSLLNWGFAVDGKVAPVGTLVGALVPPAPVQPATRDHRAAARPPPVPAGPSVLAAAGFSCVALIAAGLGFAYSRRQRVPGRAGASAGRLEQADALTDGRHGLRGDPARLRGAVREQVVQPGLVGEDPLRLFPDRGEGRDG